MKSEKELKEIFVKIISYFYNSDIDGEVLVWDKIVENYTNFDGGEILKKKTNNLLKIANKTKQTSEEEYKKLLARDVEDDIWYVV